MIRTQIIRVVSTWLAFLACIQANAQESKTLQQPLSAQTRPTGGRGTRPDGENPRAPTLPRHAVTIREIISFRRPSGVQISPDAHSIAYVVTKPILERNEDHSSLYVRSIHPDGEPLVIAEAVHITEVRWSLDSRWLFYVAETADRSDIWRVKADGTGREQVTDTNGQLARTETSDLQYALSPFELSPDGQHIAYAIYNTAAANDDERKALQGGRLYTGEFVTPLAATEYRHVPFELWIEDLGRHAVRKILTIPTFTSEEAFLPEFRWSGDGQKIALLYPHPDDRYTLAILDRNTTQVEDLVTTLGFSTGLTWSDDNRSLFLMSEGILKGNSTRQPPAKYQFSLTDHRLKKVATDHESVRSASDATSETALQVERSVEQRSGDLLSFCSIDTRNTIAACVREAPMVPPEVVLVELQDGVPIGKVRRLTHLNPEYDAIELGQVSRLTWPNKEGQGSAGLILPVGYVSGKRYPLVVMLYNLYSGRRFILDGGGFTSYPAQAFAGHGYVVLLMNVGKYYLFDRGNFASARDAMVNRPIAEVRSAVDIVLRRGLVNPKKMGIMGWSGGSFWTTYIVTHYPTWFNAAASGEGGITWPGHYWLRDDVWRKSENEFFGGGPYGKYYPRWKEISPVLNVDHLKIPLLQEYSESYTFGLEMRTAIMEAGGQTDLYIYLDDKHVFVRPLNRYNSMMRNYDWFNYWLLGEEDSDPSKAEQYKRWRKMRKLQDPAGANDLDPNEGTSSSLRKSCWLLTARIAPSAQDTRYPTRAHCQAF